MSLAVSNTPMMLRSRTPLRVEYQVPDAVGAGWIVRRRLTRGALSSVHMKLDQAYQSRPRVALRPLESVVVLMAEGVCTVRTRSGGLRLEAGCAYVLDGPVLERWSGAGQRTRQLVYHLHEAFLPSGRRPLDPDVTALVDRLLDPGPPDDLEQEADALRLLARLQRTALEPHWTERARALLLADVAGPPSLVEIAEAVGVHPRSLTRAFRAHFGTSVFGVLREERIRRARELLATTDLPVEDVSARLGFSSPSHLARVFRAQVGLSPTAFRRSA